MLLHVEVCEEDYGRIGGEEDEDVPGAVQVGEADGRPELTEKPQGVSLDMRDKSPFSRQEAWVKWSPVGHPADQGGSHEPHGPRAQTHHPLTLLWPQLGWTIEDNHDHLCSFSKNLFQIL